MQAVGAGTPVAVLSDPANPSFIPIAATVGAILAGAFARVRRDEPDEFRYAAERGAFWGGIVGILIWAAASIVEVAVL